MAGQDSPSAGNTSPPTEESRVNGGPITTGALVAIIVVSSVVAITGFAYFCLWLARRHRAKRQGQALSPDQDTDAVTAEVKSSGSRKLSKKNWSSTFKSRESSPVRSIALPAVPPAFRQPSLFFHGNPPPGHKNRDRGKKGGWVDEDVLHDPRAKQKEAGQRSSRDSWPMKDMVPALQRLSGIQQPPGYQQQKLHQHHQQHYQRQQQLQQQQQPQLHLQQNQGHHQQQKALLVKSVSSKELSQRKLPQPPPPVPPTGKQQQVPSNPGRQYHAPGDTRGQRSMIPSSPTGSAVITPQHSQTRYPSTDSTLSEILKSTEKRLQASVMNGSTKANKSTVSLLDTARASRETLVASGGAASDGSTLSQSRPHSRTPSPTKAHQRKISGSSAASDPDSFTFSAHPSPGGNSINGQVSPSMAARARQLERQLIEAQSPSSSVSSALSTLYSEDETQEAMRVPSTLNRNVLTNVRSVPLPPPFSRGDPFFSGTPLSRPNPGHGSQTQPQGRAVQNSNKTSALGTRVVGQGPEPPAAASNPRDSIRLVKSTSSNSLARAGSSHQHQSNTPVKRGHSRDSTLPALPTSWSPQTPVYPKPGMIIHRSIPSTERPSFVVTSPSAASLLSPALSDLSFLQSYIQVGSPNQKSSSRGYALRPQASSPTLGRHSHIHQDIPPLPPVPTAFIGQGDSRYGYTPTEPSSPTRQSRDGRARRRSSRVVSASSSIYSQTPTVRGSPNSTTATPPSLQPPPKSIRRSLGKDGTPPPPSDGTARVVTPNNGANTGTNTNRNSVTSTTSRIPRNRDTAPLDLAAAISQLRRMNSSTSTYSVMSTFSTAPTQPGAVMRRGSGVSQAHRGVAAGVGTKNYLSLGSRSGGAKAAPRGAVGRRADVGGAGSGSGSGSGSAEGSRAGKGQVERGGGNRKVLQLVRGLESGSVPQLTKGKEGLREGSDGNRGTPSRKNSVRSFEKLIRPGFAHNLSQDSLGLYDRDGFLITGTPARKAVSPNRPQGLRA